MIRFAIPSKGALYEGTLQFLESCGLKVSRPNPRQYTATIRTLPGVEVVLQRVSDIVQMVAAGDVDLGVTGLDVVREYAGDEPNVLVADANLGFGRSELVMAVPEAWVDVQGWPDLADLAAEFANSGRQLRIATKFPNLVRDFCYRGGVNVFTLIDSQGATEAAPALGYADLIADTTETGTTLRENRLKIVAGTTILQSQACLIAGRRALRQDPAKLEVVQAVLELIEARRRARGYAQLIANVPGPSAEQVAARVTESPDLGGLQGPTVAPVYGRDTASHWFAISVIVGADRILPAVEHLRKLGSTGIVVLPLQYAFGEQSESFRALSKAVVSSEF
jgi:ATP phosphoribosyltransferase